MLSLAPFNYRALTQTPNDLFREQKIVTVNTPILGDFFESYVYLQDHLKPLKKHEFKLYGSPDGSGTAFTKNEAYYRAVSEGLERWAFYSTSKSDDRINYGFDVEPSSTGMAAFPGFFKSSARKNAYYEAVERCSIAAWWEESLSHRQLNFAHQKFSGIEIRIPFKKASVVILWAAVNQFTQVYAFACHGNVTQAVRKAQVELSRNYCVLKGFSESHSLELKHAKLTKMNEIRLAYFASQEGQQTFDARLNKQPNSIITSSPKKLVDTEIVGAWSKYTTVWRVLFESISKEHLSSRADYFLF